MVTYMQIENHQGLDVGEDVVWTMEGPEAVAEELQWRRWVATEVKMILLDFTKIFDDLRFKLNYNLWWKQEQVVAAVDATTYIKRLSNLLLLLHTRILRVLLSVFILSLSWIYKTNHNELNVFQKKKITMSWI